MNRTYVVSYDLIAPGRNYQNLTSALVTLGASRVLLSQWIVRLDTWTAAQIRDYLSQYMDANDRIMVNRIDQEWAALNLLLDPNIYTTAQ